VVNTNPTAEEAFQILETSPQSPIEAVKKAYYQLALANHEDRILPLKTSAPEEYKSRTQRFKDAANAYQALEAHFAKDSGKASSPSSITTAEILTDIAASYEAAKHVKQQEYGHLLYNEAETNADFGIRVMRLRDRLEHITDAQLSSQAARNGFKDLYREILHDELYLVDEVYSPVKLRSDLDTFNDPYGSSMFSGDGSVEGRQAVVDYLTESRARAERQVTHYEQKLPLKEAEYDARFAAFIEQEDRAKQLEGGAATASTKTGIMPLTDLDDMKYEVRQGLYKKFIRYAEVATENIEVIYLPTAKQDLERVQEWRADRTHPDNGLEGRDTFLKVLTDKLTALQASKETTEEVIKTFKAYLTTTVCNPNGKKPYQQELQPKRRKDIEQESYTADHIYISTNAAELCINLKALQEVLDGTAIEQKVLTTETKVPCKRNLQGQKTAKFKEEWSLEEMLTPELKESPPIDVKTAKEVTKSKAISVT